MLYFSTTWFKNNKWKSLASLSRIGSGQSGGVLWKRCSKNKQKIDRRTPMPKGDFNKFL